jgi:hypothetical protein
MKSHFQRSAFLSLILLAVIPQLSNNGRAQTNAIDFPGAIRSSAKINKSDGWELPAKASRLSNSVSTFKVGEIAVDKQVFDPKSAIVPWDDYFQISPGEIRIVASAGRYGSITEYSVRGRVFAVQTNFNPIVDGQPTAAVQSVYFVDVDGDGRFEVRYLSSSFPKLPRWVEELR